MFCHELFSFVFPVEGRAPSRMARDQIRALSFKFATRLPSTPSAPDTSWSLPWKSSILSTVFCRVWLLMGWDRGRTEQPRARVVHICEVHYFALRIRELRLGNPPRYEHIYLSR